MRQVLSTEAQSTLFRTNSIATKMFKTYSKMIGLPYMHETLGIEINKVSFYFIFIVAALVGCRRIWRVCV